MSADGGNTAYRVTLPEFEGPLDLLLHLCKTHEIDIVNIPIAFITRKYLEYLEVMQTMSVDVAADYLVMAATLAYLKSRELVPTPEPLDTTGEEGGEELDPREELIRRLLEYQKYKNAAEQLGGRPIEGRTVFPRGVPIDKDDPSGRPFGDHSIWKLIEAFGKILEKTGKAPTTHDVIVDRVSIGTRIGQLHERLRACPRRNCVIRWSSPYWRSLSWPASRPCVYCSHPPTTHCSSRKSARRRWRRRST